MSPPQDAALKALAKQFGGGDAQLQEQAAGPAASDLEAQVNPKKRKADEKKEAAKAAKKAELEALPNKNPQLVAIFEELADLVLKYGGEKSHFGAAAYRKVALRLREVDAVITSGKEAGKLDGVGKKSADVVESYLKTQKVPLLEEFRAIDRGELVRVRAGMPDRHNAYPPHICATRSFSPAAAPQGREDRRLTPHCTRRT